VKAPSPEFDGQNIRRVYDKKTKIWWFSVVDVVQALTDSENGHEDWAKMKRLAKFDEGAELSTLCRQMKLPGTDGKQWLTDVANVESILRIVQSIPNPHAESIKLWQATVGFESLQELADPALLLDRARQAWRQQGHSDTWISQRMTGQGTRNNPVDHWRNHEIAAQGAHDVVTSLIHHEQSGLGGHQLCKHMSEADQIFSALAELATQQISESVETNGMAQSQCASESGGGIAAQARCQLERQTGRPVV
jgi:hypothetical protein